MNHADLVSVGIAALTFAKRHQEIDQWWQDNLPWIRRVKEAAPAEYARLIEAGKAKRATIGPR